MGLSGISPMSLLLILAIILILFGSHKVKDIGSDLGEAIKRFRKSMNENDDNKSS
ncbi:twin-arginine translocase TatA/TatE family subunit [Legionella sp. W05-934-2]|jgi:sec-independent protein translocase protein TatA|uniref:twin-arginine translocase TatA/TatE family subunit n=1 Tax=Legionella sp. W05-934-2 TaxID=1198649 RepID=UPI003463374A